MSDQAVALGIAGIADASLVGRGGYGTVYRARQVRFNREVAVKMLTGELDEAALVRFERECSAMGMLSGHPHIVTVFDSGLVGGRPYLIMEYLSGGSLHDRLAATGPVGWSEVLDIGVKLSGALESAHRQGVLHRDVKPENVFVDSWGEPQLGDFGIARVQGAYETSPGKVTATLVHAAPELLAGQAPTDASDLYALASTLYELLAGVPAFYVEGEETIAPLLQRIALSTPPDLRGYGIPSALVEVVEQSLAKDPGVRPGSVALFGRLLQAAQLTCGQPKTRMLVHPATEADRIASGKFPAVPDAPPSPAAVAPARMGLPPPKVRMAPPPPPRPAPRRTMTGPPRPPSLLDQVAVLLETAMGVYAGTASGDRLARVSARLTEPLRVAIAGRVKAGKSTMLNALVGEELAPTDAGECTRVVTWYIDGPQYKATLHPRHGTSRSIPFHREHGAIEFDLGADSVTDVERVVIEWPSSALRSMTLIDTPGLASISEELSVRTERTLAPGSGLNEVEDSPADAVIYLMRHLHPADLDFLEAFGERGHSQASPVNAVAVLSRADEVGVGRIDAMQSAARVAERYRTNPKLRRVCHTIVPVAGLVAQAGVTLREDEFRAVQRLARTDAAVVDELLLSVHDFVDPRPLVPLTSIEREALLDRFGLFGVRLAIDLVRRDDTATSSRLADALVAASGLAELRQLLMVQFAGRRDVLKARAALAALDAVCRTDPRPGSDALAAELERITSAAHELVEIRLLDLVRSGAIRFRTAELDEVERLLGAAGASPAARLGMDADAAPDQVRAVLYDTAARWQRRAEHPMTTPNVADAARVLVRTCEGLLVTMG